MGCQYFAKCRVTALQPAIEMSINEFLINSIDLWHTDNIKTEGFQTVTMY